MKIDVSGFLKELPNNPKSLIIIVGFAGLLLGAAGGIPYKNIIYIPPEWQIVLVATGILVLLLGIWLVKNSEPVDTHPYGIKITNPTPGISVSAPDVTGSISRMPPNDHELWIVRIYPRTDDFIPLRRIHLEPGQRSWVAAKCDVGGKPNDDRALGVLLVPKAGRAFFDYFFEATQRHNTLMAQFSVPADLSDRYLPNISPTVIEKMGMTLCHRVNVVRA